jgi:hypothetical protein
MFDADSDDGMKRVVEFCSLHKTKPEKSEE